MKVLLLVTVLIVLASSGIVGVGESPRTIFFSGRTWQVKTSTPGLVGPGPNYFSNSAKSVWVDASGYLHMKIRKINGVWHSSEVVLSNSLGYGKYILYTASRIDLLDKNLVLGIFTYDYLAPDVSYRQLDVEVSKWGYANNDIGQFVVQTTRTPNNIVRFPINLGGNYATHIIDWNTQRINFSMIHGHYQSAPSSDYLIKQWSFVEFPVYKGSEKFIINLWQMNGLAPSNGKEAEVIIKKFEFIPDGV